MLIYRKVNEHFWYVVIFIFADLLKDLVVAGKTITAVEIQVMDKNYPSGPNSVSNGKHYVGIGCQ